MTFKMKIGCNRNPKKSLKVANLVKMFMWRACSNILPTKENLLRGVLKEAVCILCTQEIESTRHAVCDCPSARDVWEVVVGSFRKLRLEVLILVRCGKL
jgi:hypothetical protein